MVRALIVAFLSLTLGLVGPEALAEETPGEGDKAELVEKAKQHFQQAEVQYRLSRFEEALTEYQAALALVRRPSIILNIAQCLRQLKRWEKAIFYYRLYIADYRRDNLGADPPHLKTATRHIERLTKIMEEVKLRRERTPASAPAAPSKPRSGAVRLSGLPAGSRIEVDGELVARAPLKVPLMLDPGQHRLNVSRFGFTSWEGLIAVEPGGGSVERVELRRTRLWLILSITCGALAAGAEVAAVLLTLEAREEYHGTDEWERYRNGALASHITAGVMAAAAVGSFLVHWRLGKVEVGEVEVPAKRAGLAPVRGGAMVTGELAF